jgi:splicing factor 3B subunit 3
LYQIAHLGDDDDEPEFSSAMPLEEGDTFFFAPRALRNLVLVDEIEALSPILACQVADLGKKNYITQLEKLFIYFSIISK